MFVSHFPRFSAFSLYSRLQCAFFIFHVFQSYYPYSRSYTVCVSFCTFFSFFSITQILLVYLSFLNFFTISCHIPGSKCVFLILHNFQCFSPYFMSYHVIFSFSMFFSFLALLLLVLLWTFLIFHIFQCFSRHIPGPTVWVSHFPFWSVFLPYSRSYRVYFSFFTVFNVSLLYFMF